MDNADTRHQKPEQRVSVGYYDVIAATQGAFGFLSPVKWPEWLEATAQWMCQERNVAEIGAGYGELVERCLAIQDTALSTYYLLDSSQGMLDAAYKRATKHASNVGIVCCKWDASSHNLPPLLRDPIDRVAAINVLQDTDAATVLRNVERLLRTGGLLRATYIRRETQDAFWLEDESYDSTEGKLYNISSLHEAAGLLPVGRLRIDQQQIPYYRVQKYFAQGDVERLIRESGLSIVSLSVLMLPREIVMKRWSTKAHRLSLNSRQLALLDQWGGFPDSYDVIAEKR
jgi:ubiquinone/menaquinone biosynthesis C-methylase UbiE